MKNLLRSWILGLSNEKKMLLSILGNVQNVLKYTISYLDAEGRYTNTEPSGLWFLKELLFTYWFNVSCMKFEIALKHKVWVDHCLTMFSLLLKIFVKLCYTCFMFHAYFDSHWAFLALQKPYYLHLYT